MSQLATESITESTAPIPPPRTVDPPSRLAVIVLALVGVLTLMLLAFAAPALSSGPEGLPLAVSGPEQGVSRVTAALDKEAPGTFDVTTYGSADEAERAILDREAVGGIAVGAEGVTIQTASGAGASHQQLLTGIGSGLERSGQKVTTTELAATTDDDPSGVGVAALGFPLVFGGMATAALLTLAYRGPVRMRLAGATALALLGGLVVAGILQFGFGVFDGPYGLIALSISAGILAIGATVLGLGALVGTPGIGIGAVTMLLVANPLSGLANGPEWLPQPWGEIGQYLPVGAAGSLIRSVAYFDGGGAAGPAVVLVAWIVAGVALAGLGAGRQRRRTAA